MDKNLIHFRKLILEGWERRIVTKGKDVSLYHDRLQMEVSVISKLNLVNYFLIVHDALAWSRKMDILIGVGRGSSSGSLVCYLLEITQLDPIEHGLLFERFLNVNRADMADIDIDVQDDRRAELVAYLREKYGYDKTSQIGTFGYLSATSAFRDVCSVMEIPSYQINELSKMIDGMESFKDVPELRAFVREHPDILRHVKKLNGVIRSVGTHAAGLVISSMPIEDVAVIERRKDSEVCNWDKRVAEAFGLLKMDFLGLSTLTVLNRARHLIQKEKGISIDLNHIPLDDPETMQGFRNGETVGIFQFEKSFVREVLKRTQPRTLDHLAQITSLCRPGPMMALVDDSNTMLQQYIRVAEGRARPYYKHKALQDILHPTMGVIIYQEQVMQVFQALAGFTLAEADEMRKIIGRKMEQSAFEPYKEKFVLGCVENGVDATFADHMFAEIQKFAGYGFNKSHAMAYAYNSFASMYLKVHYPIEYMASLLSFTTKVANMPIYIRECTKMGIKVQMPDINLSTDEFIIVDGKILTPLNAIKGVGESVVREILTARGAGFKDLDDFLARVKKRTVNKGKVDALQRAGVFDSFGLRNPDEEERHMDMSELLDIFNELPTFDFKGGVDLQTLKSVLGEAESCSVENGFKFMSPVRGAGSAVMVINKHVKNEQTHLTNNLSKYILSSLAANGISKRDIYYTGGYKCFNAGDEAICQEMCPRFLIGEIVAVKPKVIMLCDRRFQSMFFSPRLKWDEIVGRVFFVKKYETYVIPCPTPQMVAMGLNEEAKAQFDDICEMMGEIFS